MKSEVTLESIKTFLQVLEGDTIETIVGLHGQEKATQTHGMIAVMLAICSLTIFRFCSRLAREILSKNGMSKKQINYFLNFSEDLDEV